MQCEQFSPPSTRNGSALCLLLQPEEKATNLAVRSARCWPEAASYAHRAATRGRPVERFTALLRIELGGRDHGTLALGVKNAPAGTTATPGVPHVREGRSERAECTVRVSSWGAPASLPTPHA